MINTSHNRIAVITGLTGVGKDFLTDRLVQDEPIKVVNWGTLLGSLLRTDRDTMMTTTNETEITKQQFAVCDALINMQPIAVTCHTVRSRGTDIEYNLALEEKLNPYAYIFVSAPAEIIGERVTLRNDSGVRNSEELRVSEIERLQNVKRQRVAEIATYLGSRFFELENLDGLVGTNVAKLATILAPIN